jgi:predicted dehydrogenase
MANSKARIGIIGVGWWTTTAHIPGMLKNPDAELVAVADRRPEVMQKASEKYGLSAKQYTDYKAMLAEEKLDGVIVATNHTSHYENAKACLDAGLHVMLEKPMVLKASHAHDLRDTAQRKGVELIIGYPWHYIQNTRTARDIIQSGELGAIEYVSSLFTSMVIEYYRGDEAKYRDTFNFPVTGPGSAYSDPNLSGGGQGHLQVTHSAGTLFFVIGLQADRVSSFMNNLGLAVDVADAISVRFKSQGRTAPVGVLGSTGNLGIGDSGVNELQVCCEHGRLTLEHMSGTLYVRKHDGQETHYEPTPAADRYPMYATGDNLVSVIVGKGGNESPAEVGVRVVELLDAAYRSAAEDGKPFSVADL